MDDFLKGLLSQEQHDCIVADLNDSRYFQKRDENGQRIVLPDFTALDQEGAPRLDDDGKEIIIKNRPDMETDSDGNQAARPMTVRDWVIEALEGKAHSCRKRAHMKAFES